MTKAAEQRFEALVLELGYERAMTLLLAIRDREKVAPPTGGWVRSDDTVTYGQRATPRVIRAQRRFSRSDMEIELPILFDLGGDYTVYEIAESLGLTYSQAVCAVRFAKARGFARSIGYRPGTAYMAYASCRGRRAT